MSDDERLTWRKVEREIEATVQADVESGEVDLNDEDAWSDYAHEWADGSQYVIYTYASRTLWADGLPDGAEEEADEYGPHESIDQWITIAVYCAMREAIMSALDGARDAHEYEPRCDACGLYQIYTENLEWNGETGNHVECESE